MMLRLREYMERMAPEFGVLDEELGAMRPIEQEVSSKLERSAKLDEIDTVCFGLETDDGKIVKTYVKAEQADDFEKALAEKLGEVDDIEECLNLLAKDFEIVDVVWPDDDKKKDDEDDENGEADDEDEDTGSDALNPKVYANRKEQGSEGHKPRLEHLDFGERAALSLNESDGMGSSIERRMVTAQQLMVFHGILELGIPELALNKSPYRAAIIQGIKAKALELSKNAAVKNALKLFITRSINYDLVAHKNREDLQKDHGELVGKNIESEIRGELHHRHGRSELYHRQGRTDPRKTPAKEDAKTVKEARSAWEDQEEEKVGKPAILTVRLGLGTQLGVRPPDPVKKYCKEHEIKLENDARTCTFTAPKKELEKMIEAYYFNFKESENDKPLAEVAKHGPRWVKVWLGMIKTKRGVVDRVLGRNKSLDEALTEAEKLEWKFERDDEDRVVLSCPGLTVKLNAEEAEKCVKGVSNRDVVVVRDDEDATRKVVFSPRGTSVQVKWTGTEPKFLLTSHDVDDLLELIGHDERDDEKHGEDDENENEGKEEKPEEANDDGEADATDRDAPKNVKVKKGDAGADQEPKA